MLGICLGMQLLFEHGTESGLSKGLNYIKGSVNVLDSSQKTKLDDITYGTNDGNVVLAGSAASSGKMAQWGTGADSGKFISRTDVTVA